MKEIDRSFTRKKINKKYLFWGILVCGLSLGFLLFNFSFSIGDFKLSLSIFLFSLGAGLIWYATVGQMTADERNKIQAEKYIIRSHHKKDED